MEKKKKSLVKVRLPAGRISYPSVFEKRPPMQAGGTAKFECTFLIPKKTDIKELKSAIFKEAVREFGPQEDWPESLKMPLKDGDKKKDQKDYAGHWYVKATSTQPIGVLDTDKTPLTAEDQAFYAGCWAVATVVVKAYNKGGGKGVTLYLNNVMKTRDDKPFSGRASAEDDFADIEVSDISEPEEFQDEDLDSNASAW